MPTYQYACTECDHSFEQQQSFSDDSLTECPSCSGRLRKLFNAVGVVFKGSGFYRTDSRSASAASVPATDSSSGEKSGEKSATSSASEKPAATSEAKPVAAAASSSSSSSD